MAGSTAPDNGHIAVARNGSRYGLAAIAAAETGDKGMGNGSVLEIKRKGVVENARRTGGSGGPTFCAASFVVPGVIELAAQTLRRYRYPHAHRIPTICLALGPHRCSDHKSSPVLDSFERYL